MTDDFIEEPIEEGITDIIRRKITYRILLSLLILFVFFMGSLIYELSGYESLLRQSTEKDYRQLQSYVLSQLLADNDAAIGYKLNKFNQQHQAYNVIFIKDNKTVRHQSTFKMGLTWKILYPSLQYNGQTYGYLVFTGEFYRSPVFQRFLLLIFGYLLVFMLAAIVIYPVYKRVPNDLIITPLMYMLEIIRKKERVRRDQDISQLPTEIKDILYSVESLMDEVESSTKLAATYKIAARVAHDIRSPLAVLNSVVEEYRQTKHFDVETITAVSRRISKIADDIVTQINPKQQRQSIVLPFVVIKEVMSEKEYLNKDLSCQFTLQCAAPHKLLYCQANGLELGRVLSNLLNNAMEAVKENGKVTVNLSSSANHAVIAISDDGVGMAAQAVQDILSGTVISTKAKGSGIGLKSAIEYVKSLQGRLTIDSALGCGTTVSIHLPLAQKPAWALTHLVLDKQDSVLVVDDEPIIYERWQQQLTQVALNTHYISGNEKSVKAFDYINESDYSLYLLDYQNPYIAKDGVEMINDYQLKSKALLVTSNYDDALLQKICGEQNIKLLPKTFINELAVETVNQEASVVLVDDDRLFAKSFRRQAELRQQSPQIFSDRFNLQRCIDKLNNKQAAIYIDLSIEQDNDGLQVAQILHDKGFSRLMILSGSETLSTSHFPAYIKAVYNKANFNWELLIDG